MTNDAWYHLFNQVFTCTLNRQTKPLFYGNLFCFWQHGLDIQNHIAEKERALEVKGLRLQPHVAICDDIADVGNPVRCVAYAVITPDLFYGVSSVMVAVDVCLKACFVFNVHYCIASQSTWVFLQRALYAIRTPQDCKNSKVLQLLAGCSRLWCNSPMSSAYCTGHCKRFLPQTFETLL